MTIYREVVNGVKRGYGWYLDFYKRDLKLNGKFLVKGGVYQGNLGVSKKDDVIAQVQERYIKYRYSCPNDRHQGHKSKFRALEFKEMTPAQLVLGADRELAQAELEVYLFLQILNGFEWPFGDKWFYAGTDGLRLRKDFWSKYENE